MGATYLKYFIKISALIDIFLLFIKKEIALSSFLLEVLNVMWFNISASVE